MAAIKLMLAVRVLCLRFSRERKAAKELPSICGMTLTVCPTRYRLKSPRTAGSAVKNLVRSKRPSTRYRRIKQTEIIRDRIRFSEKTFLTLSCLFPPIYLPHRMVEPPTRTVLMVEISIPMGL